MKYAFRADITYTVDVPEGSSYYFAAKEAMNLLPHNTVILDLRGWPSGDYSRSNAAELESMAHILRILENRILDLEAHR